MLQAPPPVIVVDLFPEVLDRLLELLGGLAVGEWQKPTACAGWSVKDVALHLLGVEIGNLSRHRDSHTLSGDALDGWEELVAFVDDWNQEWVRVARRISSPLLIDLLQLTGRQMCQVVRTLDPNALGGPVSWAGPEPAPVWLDLAREYTERWHHQQHIRDAVGKPGLRERRYLHPALATFVRALPRAFAGTRAEEGTSVTLNVSGPSGGQWTVRQEADAWRLYEGSTSQPAAEAMLEAEVAWRLFTRGLDPEMAWQHVRWVGDRALVTYLLEMVSIIA